MLVYGKNVAELILKKKEKINKIYLWEKFTDKNIISLIKKENYKVEKHTKNELNQLANVNHQGIIIDINNYKFFTIDDILQDKESKFIVLLDHLEDPHNFGAILRTCECAGVDYVIIQNKRSVSVNPTVMKTSSGALLYSKICEVSSLNSTIQKLKQNGYFLIGTDMDGDNYKNIKYPDKVALIIGSEGNGLKYIVKQNCDIIASIPMKGKVNSLNASVAAGIVIYEIVNRK